MGVDIGGTFTDLVLVEAGSGRTHSAKTLTTPADPVEGVMAAVRQGLDLAGAAAAEVQRVVHATTLPTNLVIERRGGRVGFIATAGFGDMFHIGKQHPSGPERFNLFYQRPEPLVPRGLVTEVQERVGPQGQVVRPLDVADADAAIAQLAAAAPDSVAICLLHAYANPSHERQVAELVRRRMPGTYVAISSEVWPEYQEYDRASTTVLSAYIGPTLARYVGRLEEALRKLGVSAGLQIMQSSGAVMSAAETARRAAYAIESGPAAGVMAGAHMGRLCGTANLICFDMGGTTAKAGLVEAGQPRVTHSFRVGGGLSTGGHSQSGEPVRVPVIDLAEVGAGGGSIAWVDAGGFLQVGPRSSGSVPGPACYGNGGEAPTVTDANLVLGYLNPDYFLGGAMPVDPDLSRRALAAKVAGPLGMEVVAAARGIHELANTLMSDAIRMVTLQRGLDPREHALFASGGAGPIHVARLAQQFGIPTVIVPPSPGVRSAFGLLISDLAHDFVATRILPAESADVATVAGLFGSMEARGRTAVQAAAEQGAEIRIERQIDVRLAHQHQMQTVAMGEGQIDRAALDRAIEGFRDLYQQTFGMRPKEPCEFVNYRLRAVAVVDKPVVPKVAPGGGNLAAAAKPTRQAYFIEAGGFVATPVYDRARLTPGDVIQGPAIIEEPDSTTVCPPGCRIEIDGWRNLVLAVG